MSGFLIPETIPVTFTLDPKSAYAIPPESRVASDIAVSMNT